MMKLAYLMLPIGLSALGACGGTPPSPKPPKPVSVSVAPPAPDPSAPSAASAPAAPPPHVDLCDAATFKAVLTKCDGDDASACLTLGTFEPSACHPERPTKRSQAEVTAACEKNDSSSCQTLGSRFATGDPAGGVAQDLTRSFELHTKACTLGSAAGCFSVGFMHEYGEHVPKNANEARKWYEKACTMGSGGACNNLALAKERGPGKIDRASVVALFERGCSLKDGGACSTAGTRFAELGQRDKALEHWDKACELGDANWCAALGSSYVEGHPIGPADGPDSQRVGVEANLPLARKYFSKACARGMRLACGIRQEL